MSNGLQPCSISSNVLAGMTKEGEQSPIIAIVILLIFIGVFAFAAVLLRLV
jgi:hypothetical protein